MQNARTPHRLIRIAAAGLAGAAALLSPLAGVADAELSSPRDPASRADYRPFTVKAGTVTSINGILTIDAATNTRNIMSVLGHGGDSDVMVADFNAPLIPGAGCITVTTPVPQPMVRCADAVHVVVRLGSGDDSLYMGAGSVATADVDAGPGNDVVTTVGSSDFISGGTGADTIKAGDFSDVLIGGDDPGFDVLNGGSGPDDCYQGEAYLDCDNGVINEDDVR